MIGGDVVTQNGQRTHTFHGALGIHCAFPIRWAANVGAHFTPVVERVNVFTVIHTQVEHWLVHFSEMLRLDRFSNNSVNLFIAWPDIFKRYWVAVFIGA